MSETEDQRWQVPAIVANDSWHEVPLWVMSERAVPYPRGRWTLPNGTIAEPGDYIVSKRGELEVEKSTTTI
jgi:hypothetical protein